MRRFASIGAFLLAACSDVGPEPAQPAAAPPSWFGHWQVVGHRLPGVSAVSDGEAATHHGQTASFTEAEARFEGQRCAEPRYESRTLTAAELHVLYRLSPAELGLTEPVTQIEVHCAIGTLNLGATLLVQSANALLTPWDGAFYELHRY